jgi:hypothetical protein
MPFLVFTKRLPEITTVDPANYTVTNTEKTLLFETGALKRTCLELLELGCAFRRCSARGFDSWADLKSHTSSAHKMYYWYVFLEQLTTASDLVKMDILIVRYVWSTKESSRLSKSCIIRMNYRSIFGKDVPMRCRLRDILVVAFVK